MLERHEAWKLMHDDEENNQADMSGGDSVAESLESWDFRTVRQSAMLAEDALQTIRSKPSVENHQFPSILHFHHKSTSSLGLDVPSEISTPTAEHNDFLQASFPLSDSEHSYSDSAASHSHDEYHELEGPVTQHPLHRNRPLLPLDEAPNSSAPNPFAKFGDNNVLEMKPQRLRIVTPQANPIPLEKKPKPIVPPLDTQSDSTKTPTALSALSTPKLRIKSLPAPSSPLTKTHAMPSKPNVTWAIPTRDIRRNIPEIAKLEDLNQITAEKRLMETCELLDTFEKLLALV